MINLDHFLIGVPKLDSAVEAYLNTSGVRPELGGRHPKFGTHNALVSLGTSYLELISFDGSHKLDTSDLVSRLNGLATEKLIGWCLRCDSFEKVRVSLHSFGLELGEVGEGQRETPDGNLIRYQFAELLGLPEPNLITPFFVRWHSDTVMPSVSAPKGCELAEFSVSYLRDSVLMNWLKSLNLGIKINIQNEASLGLKIRAQRSSMQFHSNSQPN